MTTPHGSEPRGQADVPRSTQYDGLSGRMFRRLPPCPPYPDDKLIAIAESMRESDPVGGWGGVADELDNEPIPAAFTYFGQFVDHDITFDPVSSLEHVNDPNALTNFRTPRFVRVRLRPAR